MYARTKFSTFCASRKSCRILHRDYEIIDYVVLFVCICFICTIASRWLAWTTFLLVINEQLCSFTFMRRLHLEQCAVRMRLKQTHKSRHHDPATSNQCRRALDCDQAMCVVARDYPRSVCREMVMTLVWLRAIERTATGFGTCPKKFVTRNVSFIKSQRSECIMTAYLWK